jgi:hypothetical protein
LRLDGRDRLRVSSGTSRQRKANDRCGKHYNTHKLPLRPPKSGSSSSDNHDGNTRAGSSLEPLLGCATLTLFRVA